MRALYHTNPPLFTTWQKSRRDTSAALHPMVAYTPTSKRHTWRWLALSETSSGDGGPHLSAIVNFFGISVHDCIMRGCTVQGYFPRTCDCKAPWRAFHIRSGVAPTWPLFYEHNLRHRQI